MIRITMVHHLPRMLLLLCAVVTFCKQVRASELEVSLYGQRKLRASGMSILPVLATARRAVIYDALGEVTVFELESGDVETVAYATVPEDNYIADTTYSPDGDIFALAIGRTIEFRETDSPSNVLRTIELPPIDSREYYLPPALQIEFNATGDRLVVYDEATKALISFDLATGKSRVEQGDLSIGQLESMAVAPNGDVFLLKSDMLYQFGANGRLERHPLPDQERYRTMTVAGDSIFVVCSTPSWMLLGKSDSVVREFSLNGLDERQSWDCDSAALAVLSNRPVFWRSGAICIGVPDGSVKEVAQCPEEIERLFVATDGSRLLAIISGGLSYWDAEGWKRDPWFGQPRQRDQILAVNNLGELVALTSSTMFRSAANGELVESRLLPSMSSDWGHRSLAADGKTLAFITEAKGVFYMRLEPAQEPPRRLTLPNNGRPTRVSISEDGNAVAVRFDPEISLDDPNSGERALEQSFQSGATDGFFSQLFGISRLTESCAIFELAAPKPILGLIGKDAFLTAQTSPYLNAGRLHWAGASEIGSWSYKDETAKPIIRRTTPGEIFGGCTFNVQGDVIFRRLSDDDPDDVLARIFWFGASQQRPVEIAVERKGNSEAYEAALTADGKYAYLGRSSKYASAIVKLRLPEKEILWKVELPSGLLHLRLSQNEKFLGAKLSDSRYAVISNLDQ